MSTVVILALACAALAVPFVLAALGRDNYGDDEGTSVGDWKAIWRRFFRRGS